MKTDEPVQHALKETMLAKCSEHQPKTAAPNVNGYDEWEAWLRQFVVIRQGPQFWAVLLTGNNASHPNPPTVVYDGLNSHEAARNARQAVIRCLSNSRGEAIYGPNEVTSEDFNRMAQDEPYKDSPPVLECADWELPF